MSSIGSELEKFFGLPGPSYIQKTLSKTRKNKTLLNAVRKFQNDNGIKSSVMPPALKLLDMHGVRRTDAYETMIGDASTLLLNRLKALGADRSEESIRLLQEHLDKCFSMHNIPQIRPIVLETLSQLPKLSDKYVELVVADSRLYEDSSVRVKQQVWLRHEDLFMDACRPVIDSYFRAKQAVLCFIDPSPTNFFSSETTKSRRQWEQIQKLVTMVGEYDTLYAKLMSLIREAYLESADAIFCSMKLEVIMAAHDANADVVKNDVSHELAWCLDMCLRDKHIDIQQQTRIKNVLENAKKYTPEVVGDLAMVAADPHVVHFLCTTAIRLLRDQTAHMPRDQHGLQLIIRLLTLAASTHKIVQTQEVPPQMVDTIFFTKFLPAMASLIIEDVMRAELAKNDMVEESERLGLYSAPSDTLMTFLRAEPAAALLWIHYSVDLLPRRSLDIRGALRYLRVMPYLKDQLVVRAPWCHLLTHRLLTAPLLERLVNDPEVITIIVDRLFLASLKVDIYLKYQLLRMTKQLHRILHPNVGLAILEHISPEKVGDVIDGERYSADYSRTLAKVVPKEEEKPLGMPPPATPMQAAAATPARVAPSSTPSHSF